ncbi:MAG TPA: ComEC/Rec2 family competence protein [Candidatus Saccharimonadales bacterium]|jgi:competence protein ComEC
MYGLSWRYQRFHVSYLLGWLCAGLLIGLMLGRHVGVSNTAGLLLIGLMLLLGGFRSARWYAVPMIVLAGCSLGWLRGQAVSTDYQRYDERVGQHVQLRGTLATDPKLQSGRQAVALSAITIGGRSYPGDVYATMYTNVGLKRGDTVTINGKMRAAFASYGAAITASKLERVERPINVIRDIREQFAAAVRAHVLEPMASLGLGFVVGQRSTLPASLDDQLKIVGLTHIVVASGYNLTILVRFMMRLLARHSRYLALLGSGLLITGFVLFSGFSPSMTRAVIVTGLSLLAWYVGRRFQPVLLIGYVAAGTAVWDPMFVWSDLGWYLSFFAFAGVLIIAPLLLKTLYRKRNPSPPEQLVFETVSAEVMALPLVAISFGTIPVFALLANVLVAPFIPAAMVLTALTGVTGWLNETIGSLVGMPTTVLIAYMIAVVQWLAELPSAQVELDLGLLAVVGWYGVLGLLAIIAWRRTGYDFRQRDTQLEV